MSKTTAFLMGLLIGAITMHPAVREGAKKVIRTIDDVIDEAGNMYESEAEAACPDEI